MSQPNPVDTFYPGLRMFAVFYRNEQGVFIVIYDRQLFPNNEKPYCVIAGNHYAMQQIMNLQGKDTYILPAMSADDFETFWSTGQQPAGIAPQAFIWMNIPSPERSTDAHQD